MLWLSALYLVSLYAIQAALVVPALHGMEFVWPLFWLALGMKLAVLPFYYFHLVIWIFVSTAFLVIPGL